MSQIKVTLGTVTGTHRARDIAKASRASSLPSPGCPNRTAEASSPVQDPQTAPHEGPWIRFLAD